MTAEDRPAPRGGLRGHLGVALFLALWAGPVLWHGALGGRRHAVEPRWLHDWHDIACLFSQRPGAWHTYYVQVRRGAATWETLDTAPFFAMEPFGYRTRLHRFLINWDEAAVAKRAELAAWLFARHHERFPDAPQPTALRFVKTWSVPDRARPPRGRWRHPRIEEVAPNRLKVLSVHLPEGP